MTVFKPFKSSTPKAYFDNLIFKIILPKRSLGFNDLPVLICCWEVLFINKNEIKLIHNHQLVNLNDEYLSTILSA